MRKREQEHEITAAPVPQPEAETVEQPATVPGKVATYFKQNSEIVKGATKLVEAIAPARPEYLPDVFEVFIGGFVGDSYKVRIDGDRLVYTAYGEGYAERETVEVNPDAEHWEAFWAECDTLAIWGWQPAYGENRGDMSTLFSVAIEHEGLIARSSGSDSFPPRGRPLAESEDFGRFCSAVSRLIGWLAFR